MILLLMISICSDSMVDKDVSLETILFADSSEIGLFISFLFSSKSTRDSKTDSETLSRKGSNRLLIILVSLLSLLVVVVCLSLACLSLVNWLVVLLVVLL